MVNSTTIIANWDSVQVAGRKKPIDCVLRDQIAGQINHLRGEVGISQAELSRRSKLDPTTISKMVRGDYTFSDHHIEALASALEATPAQLMPGGPRRQEVPILEAARSNKAGEALHALAVAMGTTVRQLVATAGIEANPAPADAARFVGVGWAAASLVRSIAQAVAEDPTRAAWLVSTWLHADPARLSDNPIPDLEQLAQRFAAERADRAPNRPATGSIESDEENR